MKRFGIIVLAALLLLSSCGKNKASQPSSSSGVGRYTTVKAESESGDEEESPYNVEYNAVYVRTDEKASNDSIYPRIVTLTTRTELEKYTAENENTYEFNLGNGTASFYDTVTNYNAAFFDSSSLVMVILKETSSSYTYSNKGFTETDAGSRVNIIRYAGEENNDEIACWHIIFEVPKDSFVLDGEIKLDITEERKAE